MAIAWLKTASPAWKTGADGQDGDDWATWSGVSIGTASADRIVVVTVTCATAMSTGIKSVAIGGTLGTLVKARNYTSGNMATAMYQRLVTSGTTADITVRIETEWLMGAIGIHVGILTGATEAPYATGDAAFNYSEPNLDAPITIPANGVGVGMVGCDTTGKTASWTNATEDYNTTGTGGMLFTFHHGTAGSWNPSATGFGGAGNIMLAAAWEPAAGGSTYTLAAGPGHFGV